MKTLVAVLAIEAGVFIGAAPLAADQETTPALPTWSGPATPPEPDPGGWDWVRLASDEWVKGEILLMRDFDLDFDSDEFDLVELDWEDVAEVRTKRIYTAVLDDMSTTYTGTLLIVGDRVTVRATDGVETFDRERLVAIVPDTSTELRLWSARASAGIGLRSGNTDSSELNGKFDIKRVDENTSAKIQYSGLYGSLNEEKNTNNHRGSTRFDYFLTRDLFLVPAGFEVFSDEFQNISYRLTPTMGLGYYLVRRPRFEWQIRAGGGYQYTRLDSAPPGDSKDSDNGAAIFSTLLDMDLTSRVDLIVEYQVQVIAPDTDLTNHHAETTFEIELTSTIDFDVNFIWDRIEQPNRNSDGTQPETDDFRTTIGLSVEY